MSQRKKGEEIIIIIIIRNGAKTISFQTTFWRLKKHSVIWYFEPGVDLPMIF